MSDHLTRMVQLNSLLAAEPSASERKLPLEHDMGTQQLPAVIQVLLPFVFLRFNAFFLAI